MSSTTSTTSITPRQQRFVEEYLIDLNGTQAAIRAGYHRKRASNTAWRLRQQPAVVAAIAAAKEARRRRMGISADRVLEELIRLAFADMRQVADWGPGGFTPRDSASLSEDAARAVAEVSGPRTGGPVKVKLFDKKAALDLLGRYLGLVPAPRSSRKGAAAPGLPGSELLGSDLAKKLAKARRRLAARKGEIAGKAPDEAQS